MNVIFTIFQIITSVSGAAMVFIGGTRYRSLPHALKFLTFYFVFDLLVSLAGMILSTLHIHSLFLMNIQIPVEYALFTAALSYWVTNERFRKVVLYSIPGFIILSAGLFLTIEDFFAFSTVSRPILSALLLSCSVYVLVTTLKDTSLAITSDSRFWICSGLIMYHGGNATFFLMMHTFELISQNAISIALVFHNLISTLAYVLFLIGFLCRLKTTKP